MAKSKYTPAIRKKILRALEVGATRKMAYTMARISHETFYSWLRDYPDFLESVEQAEALAGIKQLERLEEAAANGDAATSKWILERKFPEDFGKRVDVRLQYSPDQIRLLGEVLNRMIVMLPGEDQDKALHWLERAEQGLPLDDDDELLMLGDGSEE